MNTLLEAFKELNKLDLNEEYANNLDKDILSIIETNNVPSDYITQQPGKLNDIGSNTRTKCSKSAAFNLLKAYNDINSKDIYLILGELSYKENDLEEPSNIIAHVWVEVDGTVYETNEPLKTFRKERRRLKIDKNKDLYTQVANFLNK